MKTKFSKAAAIVAVGIAMSSTAWATQTSSNPNMFSRVGTTIWHTPSIIGETFKGERSVVSKQGFFARKAEPVAERTTTTSRAHHHQSAMKKSHSTGSKTP